MKPLCCAFTSGLCMNRWAMPPFHASRPSRPYRPSRFQQPEKLRSNRKSDNEEGARKDAENQREHQLDRGFQCQSFGPQKAFVSTLIRLGTMHGSQAHTVLVGLYHSRDKVMKLGQTATLGPHL